MNILGIETSCDETSVAIAEGSVEGIRLKANIISSSLSMHAKTGGIIPEVAARAQFKAFLPVLAKALKKAFNFPKKDFPLSPPPIDAIAVTHGPGLIGPLLIGIESARTLSYVWNKPVIPVNHLIGHVYANFIKEEESKKIPDFPLIALIASGGHTDLLFFEKHGNYKVLGGTRDDAAGEAFDKIGRLLGLTYPAGPKIEKIAKEGDPKKFNFPKPLIDEKTFDFSFSGLKTAVWREVKDTPILKNQIIKDIAAGTQEAIVKVLVKKTLQAATENQVKSVILAGGVAANQLLRTSFKTEIKKQKINVNLFCPTYTLCTDNAGMIAAAAYYNYETVDWRELKAKPELYF